MPQSLSIISYMSHPKSRSKKRKKSSRKTNEIPVASFILTLLTLGCFTFYLYMNLQLVEMNFTLRGKEEELTVLDNEIKQLESKIGSSLSIKELEKKVQELKLTKADDIRYLKVNRTPSLSLEK